VTRYRDEVVPRKRGAGSETLTLNAFLRHAISLRADVAHLWTLYRSLNADQRRQFLQAAAKWQEAMTHWQDRPSLSFTLMVIACEELKPANADGWHASLL
jgi:hypothetical protein